MVTTNDMKFGIKSPWLNPLISSNLYYVRHLTFKVKYMAYVVCPVNWEISFLWKIKSQVSIVNNRN